MIFMLRIPSRIIALILTLTFNGQVQALTTAEIAQATLSAVPNCLHYQVRGVCFWRDRWEITTTTPYVEHYLPDVVVSIFNKPGDNPWFELNNSIDQAASKIEDENVQVISQDNAGFGQHSLSNPHEQSVYFKEAEVIGNPGLTVLNTKTLIKSTASPFQAYFQSMLDAPMWRVFLPQALPEKAAALGQDITRYVGQGPIRWGGVFPIEGKTLAGNEAKASAVIAQRAVNLLSLTIPGHIYQKLSNDCGKACHAEDFHEGDAHTQFQRIYPDTQTTCEVFGQEKEALSYGNDIEQYTQGAYVWVVWRYYHGCVQGSGKYLGHS